ncbi:KilA-N domain-containing protein [Vibrio sp. 10N.247.310.34]|uniref:KilA-N domain-containing protein n=1 Tax=Vibrio sp. 10N.247.310.34 TaxID=3229982 RepID=UPI0035509299
MRNEQVNIIAPNQMPVIAGIEIRVDDMGRYNLNDLHKASDLGKSKAPNKWLENASTKALVSELDLTPNLGLATESVRSVKGGINPGTYAHELLAISYAGWVSPRFQLTVNQAFLDSKQVERPELTTTEILEIALEASKERDALRVENKEQAEKIEGLENLFKDGLTAPQFGRMLNGINVQQINAFLVELGWVYRERGKKSGYRVASYARDNYMTEKENIISMHGYDSFVTATPILLQKGATKLYELYLQRKLPMKKSWGGEYTHLKLGKEGVVA